VDYRCPVCRANLAKRRLSEAVIARMEIDCSHCKSTIRLNVHPAEAMAVILGFGGFVVLAALAYWLQSHGLMLLAFGAAMLSALALPLLERTYLRTWPRYATLDKGTGRA
jgi:DNA-directed RNA polymerase subunit RPC12/RpoP